jgi:hypothetical protein
MKRLSIILPLVLCLGCGTIGQLNREENFGNYHPSQNLTFQFSTYFDVDLSGMPFQVSSTWPATSEIRQQEFILQGWIDNQYLGIIGQGNLQEDGVVWINFESEKFRTEAGKKYTFCVSAKQPDNVEVRQIVFLADMMWNWDGDDPKNPPEEG